jgi:fructose transport system substrate-binding protein
MKYLPPNRRGRRLLSALAVSSAAALVLAACGGGDTGTPGGEASGGGGGGDEEVAVTLITKTATNPFFISMQQGAEEAGKANNVTITTVAGKEDGDEATQIAAVEAAVARGDKGILITPATDSGINPAIESARQAGLYVIALDTPPIPADAVDITFATNNFKAGELIGKWAAGTMDGQKANIALLDLFNDKVATVDYNRDQGFLTGMGIDVADKTKNGDEAPTGKYTGGKGGDYQIFCNEPTNGSTDQGKTAMETCLAKSKDINLVYSINEPAGVGAAEALEAAGVKATVVSVDGGCDPGITAVKSGVIGATSQQYPLEMAKLGVEAIAKKVRENVDPQVTPGLDFYDTGVKLVTDKPVEGVESITTAEAEKICWGKK